MKAQRKAMMASAKADLGKALAITDPEQRVRELLKLYGQGHENHAAATAGRFLGAGVDNAAVAEACQLVMDGVTAALVAVSRASQGVRP